MEIIFILHHVDHPRYNIIRTVTKILILTQNITNCPKILFVFLVSFNIAAHNWLCFSLCVLFKHFICQHQENLITNSSIVQQRARLKNYYRSQVITYLKENVKLISIVSDVFVENLQNMLNNMYVFSFSDNYSNKF